MPDAVNIDGLYVHVPFCDGKCHYCAFYSVPYRHDLGAAWLAAVKAELKSAEEHHGPMRFQTLYLGGGTPTLLPVEQLRDLLSLVAGYRAREALADPQAVEWSCEANPGSVDGAKLAMMKSLGVNRISLGVQSLDDSVLRQLGRRHTVQDVYSAIDAVQGAGFINWGMDLIACVPGVSLDDWRGTLRAAVALQPPHLSVYSLTSEEGSRLDQDRRAGGFALLDDEEQLRMLSEAQSVLEQAGLHRYEISNYARPGFECRHHCSCWRGANYLGVGCAASSRVANRRWTNPADLDAYLAGGNAEEDLLTPLTDAAERLVFGLRMMEGVDYEAILGLTGLAGSVQDVAWRGTLARLQQAGLVSGPAHRLCLTPEGIALADHVAVELMP